LKLELALERLRWLPHPGTDRLVALNIPMFRLWPDDGTMRFAEDIYRPDVRLDRALVR